MQPSNGSPEVVAERRLIPLDGDQAAWFLDWLWGVRHGYTVIAFGCGGQWVDGSWKYERFGEHFYHWPDERERLLTEVGQEIAAAANGTTVDVYLCPSLRLTPKRAKHNAAHGEVLHADYDGDVPLDPSTVAGLGSVVLVASGSGEHRHVYVKCADDLSAQQRDELGQRLRDHVKGDPGKWADNDLLRLPGTHNHKSGPQPVYVAWVSNVEPLPYGALRERLGGATVPAPSGVAVAPTLDLSRLPAGVVEAWQRDPATMDGGRSDATHALVGACHRAWFTSEETIAVCGTHQWTLQKYGSRWRHEVDRCWRKIVDAAQVERRANPSEPSTNDTGRRREFALVRADEVEPRSVEWLWADESGGRVPAGALVLTAGREGCGKSSFAVWMAARVTTGTLPGACYGAPEHVLFVVFEDAWDRVLLPRLIAAGADLTRVHFVRAARIEVGDSVLTLPADNNELRRLCAITGAALVVIDPLQSSVAGSIDTNVSREVRKALDPLSALADSTGATILGLAHFNKNTNTDVSNRITASGAFRDVPRAILTFARNEDTGSYVMSQTKNSYGRSDLPSLDYQLTPCTATPTRRMDVPVVAVDGEEVTPPSWTVPVALPPIDTVRFEWDGVSATSVAEVSAGTDPDERAATVDAESWLVDYLDSREDRCAFSLDVKAAAAKSGHKERTLHRARRKCRDVVVTTLQTSSAPTVWSLGPLPDAVKEELTRAAGATRAMSTAGDAMRHGGRHDGTGGTSPPRNLGQIPGTSPRRAKTTTPGTRPSIDYR